MTTALTVMRRAFVAARPRPPLRCLSTRAFPTIDRSQNIEEETTPGYRPINYYPAHIGQVFNSRYRVITKLGYGVYSTVWLCRDLQQHRHVVVKVFIRSSAYGAGAARELRAYERLCQTETSHPGKAFVRNLLGRFDVAGPDGERHACLVHEPLAAKTSDLRPMLPRGRFSAAMLRPFCAHLLFALDFLHTEAGLIHTDIKASSILLENKDEDALADMETMETEAPSARKVLDEQRTVYRSRPMPTPKTWGLPILCDFGEARPTERKCDDDIMPEIYRAPEVILHMEWDRKVDIWNLGVMGKFLFDSRTDGDELSNEKHLSQIVAYLGPPPREFLERKGDGFLFFDEDCKRFPLLGGYAPAEVLTGNLALGKLMDAEIPQLSFEAEEENLEGRDKELFLDFVRSMLCWLPERRKSAKELLEHPWVNQDIE